MDYSKLRPIQFYPTVIEGKQMGCLNDPLKISPKPLLIPWHFVTILPLLDGRHSLLDIQAEYMRSHGDLLFKEDLVAFLEKLDHYLYLDSERFHEFQDRIKTEFLNSSVRPPFFSGLSYPSEPNALIEVLKGYFTHANGPGLDFPPHTPSEVTALIAPHIDLASGGPCFSWAYYELLRSPIVPELFIILGTCHTAIKGFFSLTGKGFQTPLGIVECDRDFLNLLSRTSQSDLYAEEFVHRAEHTIEFQILFLRFLWETYGKNWPSLRICPILCAFTPADLSEGSPGIGQYTSFVESLKQAITSYNKPVCIIVSADLAHMGPKFGDFQSVAAYGKEHCFRADQALIEMIKNLDQKGFQANMIQEYDRRRICGYPPIMTLLDLIPPSQGRLLRYDHAVVDHQGSIVTYASLAFYKTGD